MWLEKPAVIITENVADSMDIHLTQYRKKATENVGGNGKKISHCIAEFLVLYILTPLLK